MKKGPDSDIEWTYLSSAECALNEKVLKILFYPIRNVPLAISFHYEICVRRALSKISKFKVLDLFAKLIKILSSTHILCTKKCCVPNFQ